jgi:hypothetical protein
MYLSKSDYMLYLSHPAWLWLKKHNKEKLPQIDENTQATFDAGNIFESYAEKLFGDGIRLGFTDYKSYLAMPEQTLEALLGGAHTIFQPRFQTGQLTCICDVIKVVGDKTFDLYEIKSSTQVKPEHITDLAFQAHVLRESGFTVRNVSVVHVNNEYVRKGDIIPEDFCITTDVTEQVNELGDTTKQNIENALEVLQAPEIPDINPALASSKAFSEWLDIYKELSPPQKDSIYELCGLNPKKVGELQAAGISLITAIPDDYRLTPKQHKQVISAKLNQQLITEEPIRELLKTFVYPLYFLDYETLAGVVPPFEGMRPYEQLPFQYSLHIIDSPDSELRHAEYLHREGTNPCRNIAESLREHIGDSGTVVSWNMSFEASCNRTLSEAVPELAEFLQGINDRMQDLMIPFSKLWFVDKRFGGSASIKKVLPVLAPTLSYADLGIHEGASAQRLWMQAVIDGKDTIDKEILFADLLEYCKLDTLAMVEIYNVLRKI